MEKLNNRRRSREKCGLEEGKKYTLLWFDNEYKLKVSHIILKGIERCKYYSREDVLKLVYRRRHRKCDIIHYLYGKQVLIYKGWKKVKDINFSNCMSLL